MQPHRSHRRRLFASKTKPTLMQARLKQLLYYDHDTGIFWRLTSLSRGIKAGTVAGYVRTPSAWKRGAYVRVTVDNIDYAAHRVAWLYMTGEWPSQIDHVNCDGTDNRWENLRLAEGWQNCGNRRTRSDSTTGLKGVHRSGERWSARIMLHGRRSHLGVFDSKEEAHAAYCRAAKVAFGAFARSA